MSNPRNLDKKYILSKIVIDSNGCWIWQGSFHKYGYGQLGVKPYTAHKLAYILWKGEPNGVVRHTCHVPPCCNPYHLVDGTFKDNWLDSEEVHRAASTNRRGRPAHNRKSVIFRGQWYESMVHAMRDCHVAYGTVKKECEYYEPDE